MDSRLNVKLPQGVSIFTSDQLQGLTGEQGEKFCTFFRNDKQPLSSVWIWSHTIDEAIDAAFKHQL